MVADVFRVKEKEITDVCLCVCAVEPGFYSTNWLFLGKCYLQLGKVEEGGTWLKKTALYVSDVEEDNEAKREATELLKKLGISLH